uniref:Uncharacterized protein n=1 Tax=viral metagenome TaxID=1070528 RepID=A0A6C0IGA9_9ZZZZ
MSGNNTNNMGNVGNVGSAPNINNNQGQNLLPYLANNGITILFGLLLIIMIIITLWVIYTGDKSGTTKELSSHTNNQIAQDVFLTLFILFLVFGGMIMVLQDFASIKSFLSQFKGVLVVIIYTIFLILLFRSLPEKFLFNYAKIIVPISILLTGFVFFKGLKRNSMDDININYERLKYFILFFCLITLLIMYQQVDPGGLIKKYFGYSLTLTIVLAFFAFLYLIILWTLPNGLKQSTIPGMNAPSPGGFQKLLDNLSYYSFGLFILFLIIITISILAMSNNGKNFDKNFSTDKDIAGGKSSIILICVLITCIIWGGFLIFNLFDTSSNALPDATITKIQKTFTVIFGIITSGLLIGWIVYMAQNSSTTANGVFKTIINTLLVISVLALVYNIIIAKSPYGNAKKNNYIDLIINLILYIPCIFSDIINLIVKEYIIAKSPNSQFVTSIILMIITIILFFLYFKLPSIEEKIALQGGNQLVNNPVNTNQLHTLAGYQDLNNTDEFDYQYGISCWVFIDAMPPNTNPSYNNYTSILNYGNKPNILYNATTNTLMIVMEQKGLKKVNVKTHELDEHGNRIIYKKENFLLQKWNNIIINYIGGTLDIFLNNELVKSEIEVVPYMSLDNLTIGADNGINGGICNVVYFKTPLTAPNVYYLYNLVKDKTPPVTNGSNKTIITQN